MNKKEKKTIIISPLINTITVLLFYSMKEQWPTGRKNVRKQRQTRESMAPGMAGATIYHEKQRERKRESFHGVTVKEKTIKQTNVQRTQSIEGSTTIHDVLEEDGSRTFSKGKYSARLEAGRKTRNRRNAKKRTSRQRSKPEFFVFSRTKIRECTHTRLHHLLLSVFAREIRASMDFSPVSYRVSCASFRPRTRGATPLEQNGKKNEERRTNVSEPERREIGRW